MAKEGIDIKNNEQTQVTPEILDHYDKIINMAGPDHTPDWLSNHPNYVSWDIEDPGRKGLEETIIAMNNIKAKVLDLAGKNSDKSI